jgi:predicted secreted protein
MSNEPIVVCLGEDFTVELRSSPTTGYVWTVQALPEGLGLLGSSYAKPADGVKPGDSVAQIFRFKAMERGDHVISFLLKRQWEADAVEFRAVTVQVH